MDFSSLQALFTGVSDVRQASPFLDQSLIFQPHTANLVVQTWMGATLYVYLIEAAPKLRDLKNLLSANSRTGIGTLFLAHERLLPQPAKDVELGDWQDALKALTDGWIYGYTDAGTLHQVHFNPTPIAQHYQCWRFNEFRIEHVSVRRREIMTGLKGEWYLGDIASPAFKRRINYERVNQRFHYESRQTPKSVRVTPQDAMSGYYALLGVDGTSSERDVKAAFRRIAMNVHPDVSSLPRQDAERRIKELLEAYEAIKAHRGWT